MPRSRRRTTTVLGSLLTILALAVSACSSEDQAVSREEARELAGSPAAVKARQDTEERLRAVARAYADRTPLALGLIVVRDVCLRGEARQVFDPDGYDPYKIKCSLRVSAYYGAGPKQMGNILDSMLDEGDRTGSLITFGHDYFRDHLVAYYRGKGPNPIGADSEEPTQLSDPSQTLSWDPVRDRNSHRTVQEPDACPENDPPVTRCVLEPKAKTVAALRKQYGMVFQLDLATAEYYEVSRNEQP
ncbi:MAG: hypothetical protein HOV84_04010 [Streptomyces sp.]|nr:hypothetical protein [Streptomyces sp.]